MWGCLKRQPFLFPGDNNMVKIFFRTQAVIYTKI